MSLIRRLQRNLLRAKMATEHRRYHPRRRRMWLEALEDRRMLASDHLLQATDMIGNGRSPADLSLSTSTVAENQPVGTIVGSLSTRDIDLPDDAHVYTMVSGTGSADNSSFTIDTAGNLRTVTVMDYETRTNYAIRIRTTDQRGLSFEKELNIEVTDVPELWTIGPEAWTDAGLTLQRVGDVLHVFQTGTSIDAAAPRSVKDGDAISIHGRVAKNDTLTVNFSGGNPILPGGVSFDGGVGGNDALSINGYNLNTTDGVADVTVRHEGSDSGTVVLASLGKVEWGEIETLTLGGIAADLLVTLPAGADSITLGDDGGVQDANTNTNNTSALYDRSLPYSFAFTEVANPTNSLSVHRGSAADDILVLDLIASGFNANLEIGRTDSEFDQVTFSGPVTLDVNRSLRVNATGAISLPNSTSDLVTSGTGAISLMTSRNISFAGGASATTVDGDLTLSGNANGVSEGNFIGLYLYNATVSSTGSGTISVFGRGGIGGGKGIRLQNGGRIIGGSNSVTVAGIGSASGIEAVGVFVDDLTSEINSTGGNVLIYGSGGGAGYNDAAGVEVASAKIGAGGAGSLQVMGTGGLGRDNQHGIRLRGTGAQITSRGGGINIIGTAGAGDSSGILIEAGGQLLATAGAPIVTISADSMRLESVASINVGTNQLVLTTRTPGTAISLGGTDVLTGSPLSLGLTEMELDSVSAGTLQIGSATSGPIHQPFEGDSLNL